MFNLIKQRHSVAQTIILVNDPYDIDITVKDSEHDRRATSKFQGGSKNVFIRPNDSLPKSQGFNDFFRNKANKIRLQQFLKTEFSILCSNEAQKVLYSIQSYCIDLQTGQRREEFECRHMEADTILFYIYCQLRKYSNRCRGYRCCGPSCQSFTSNRRCFGNQEETNSI